MSKYTIEGNIDFQTELYKLLDEDSDDEEIFESKRLKMLCKWNEMLKKWIPIKVDSNNP